MDKIALAREQAINSEEEETQKVLYQILTHLRNVKRHKEDIADIEKHKVHEDIMKGRLHALFKKKQEEIKVLHTFYQLSKIQKYNIGLKKIQKEVSDGRQTDDQIRIKGLILVDELKRDLLDVWCDQHFDLIYTPQVTERVREHRAKMLERLLNKEEQQILLNNRSRSDDPKFRLPSKDAAVAAAGQAKSGSEASNAQAEVGTRNDKNSRPTTTSALNNLIELPSSGNI